MRNAAAGCTTLRPGMAWGVTPAVVARQADHDDHATRHRDPDRDGPGRAGFVHRRPHRFLRRPAAARPGPGPQTAHGARPPRPADAGRGDERVRTVRLAPVAGRRTLRATPPS